MSHSCSFPSKHVHFTVLVQEGESDGEPGVWVNVWYAMSLGSPQCELNCSTVIHQCLSPPDSKWFGEWSLHDFTKWSSALGQMGTLMLIPNLCLTLEEYRNETGFLHRVNSGFALKSKKTMLTFQMWPSVFSYQSKRDVRRLNRERWSHFVQILMG